MVITGYENLNIAEAANQAGFKLLIDAAKKAGLYETLETSENITIFAPSDHAFSEIEEEFFGGIMTEEDRDRLADILKYHIVSSELNSDAILGFDEIEMINGETVEILKKNGDLYINDAKVTQPDIRTKNGVIHAIDKVLIIE